MRVMNILKKFNKTYSIVIIPNNNESIRKLTIKAPLIKVMLSLLLISFISVSVAHLFSSNKTVEEAETLYESTSSLDVQAQSLNQVIEQQSKTLALTKGQLEQIKTSDSYEKNKIKEFIKMYSQIAESYIAKSNRGSAANTGKDIFDLTKLSNVVDELNKSLNQDKPLTDQLTQANNKLEKYLDAIPAMVPAKGKISSPFGMRKHPIQKVNKVHEGVDIGASQGDPILAAASGTVELAGYNGGYGRCVIIDHGNGLRTLYGHSSKLLVKKGQSVKKGQNIALVGSTGNSTGPHLHFEIRIGNTPVDPTKYVDFSSAK